jgi:hypothetical protein
LVASPPLLLSSLGGAVGGEGRKMSKKNNLAKRKKQYEFDLKSTISPLILLFPLFWRSSRSDLVLRLWW